MTIGPQPLLGHVIDRIRGSRMVHEIVVATTTAPEDDALVEFGLQKKVDVFRGSASNVLDRYYKSAQRSAADLIVRITADDPFKDPEVIDMIVERLVGSHDIDYASNTLEPTFPEGLDVEVFRFSALARAWHEAKLPSEREHVTPYIWKNPDQFQTVNVRHTEDLSKLRWTLDYEEDLHFAREVYARLYRGHVFKMKEILELLAKEPELGRINHGFGRNAGYLKSIQSEQPPSTP
jgi:spore coat polysaccharide biosynthesis protein SpsF (cytidylyltransferase family)